MDEGKPTKAKWWSRPRPNTPGPLEQGAASEWDGAQQPGVAPEQGAAPPAEVTQQPSTAPEQTRAPQPGFASDSGVGPQPGAAPERGAAPLQGAAPQPSAAPGPGAETGTDQQPSAAPEPGAAPGPGGAPTDPAPAVPPQGTPAAGTVRSGDAAPAERPRPLHDPDPYSTPPYGEPGPWAPAPPVQRPVATPAHGTSLSPVTHGGATPPHGMSAHGATPPHAAHGPAPLPGPTPPQAAPAPAPLPGATPPHAAPPPASAPGTPYGSSPHGQGAPAVLPAGPQGGPSGHVTQPQGAPAVPPAEPHGGAAPHPMQPQGAPTAPPAQPQGVLGAGAPRQPYDPWNAPLQQTGAVPPASEERQRTRARRIIVVGVALVALVSGLIGGALGSYLERNRVDAIELPQTDPESKDRPRGSVAGIAAAALPGVVTLHVRGESAQGTGTGFVLDGKGHILTNNHVVEPAGTGGEISVTFSGGETAKAKVIGRDSGYDLAVVKVSNVRGLKPLTLGNSENVQVGDPVVAIGAPFDLANTVTSGIISAKERPITAGGEKGDGSDVSYVDALQTDAPINPGNSGGPLVDSKARVIGINSAIRSADDGSDSGGGQAGSIGLGFAIPINQGKRVAEELINFGKATHPVIGVTLDTEFSGDGARIAEKGKGGGPAVNTDGPGDKAGLKPGDIITEVDGAPVHSSDELIVKVRAHRPKDRLDLTVERDGRDREVTLVLGSADGD
ncbi:trypsin-like peptidase domain-containing protein [Streptomyces sp. NPDC003032]